MIIIIRERLLSIDKFDKPKEVKGGDAIYLTLVRLMLMTPGTFQSHPEMGVGIITKWRYSDIDNLDGLKLEISKQISTYLPQLTLVEVELQVVTETKELIIDIKVENMLYRFETDSINNTLKLIDL